MDAACAGTAFGFPKAERLRTDREYRDVVRKGERTRSAHFTVYRDYRGGCGRKVGISVGRRVGGAALRNRIKRLLREFCRLDKAAFPIGSRTAIVAREAPDAPTLSGIRAELLAAIAGRWGGKENLIGPPPCEPSTSPSPS